MFKVCSEFVCGVEAKIGVALTIEHPKKSVVRWGAEENFVWWVHCEYESIHMIDKVCSHIDNFIPKLVR